MVTGNCGAFTITPNILAQSCDGKMLACIFVRNNDEIMVFSSPDGENIRTLKDPTVNPAAPHPVAFHPNGKVLLAGGGKQITFWDIESGKLLPAINNDTGEDRATATTIRCLDISPDGKLIAAKRGTSETVLFSFETGEIIRSWNIHWFTSTRIKFTPDGKQLVASVERDEKKTVVVFLDISNGELARELVIGDACGGQNTFALHPNGEFLAVTYHPKGTPDSVLQLWDLKKGKLLSTLHRGNLCSVAFSPTAPLLAYNIRGEHNENSIRLWNYSENKEEGILEGRYNYMDMEAFKRVRNTTGHYQTISELAFSPDGKLLASLDSVSLILWDVKEKKQIRVVIQR